jgi:site-specific recombinase XerD
VAATTARGYRAHLELYLIPALGDIPLTDLAAHDIARLFRDLEAAQSTRSRPLTPASIRRVYSTLRSALNAAVRQQKLERNPALQIDLASGGRPKAMVWTRERVAVWQRTGKRPSPVMVWTPSRPVRSSTAPRRTRCTRSTTSSRCAGCAAARRSG